MTQNLRIKTLTGALLAAGLATAPAFAKVDQAEADKLGAELTAVGAEVAGNADGSIPKYEGGMKGKPACHSSGLFLCDPFKGDKPKFVITAENMDQYKDKLSPGQVAMFKKYPKTYKMPVYETRRSYAVPDAVAKLTKENAVGTEAIGASGLKNFKIQGYPFPIPQSGVEVVWNHIARYKGDAVERIVGQAVPQVNGSYSMVMFRDNFASIPKLKDYSAGDQENVFQYYKQEVIAPSRLAGNVLLVHETIDQVKEPRMAWTYNADQRRVRRAPQVSYDGPGTAADGMRTADNLDMYNGAPDRYEWTLKGKREMYIPYNAYKLEEKGLPYDDMIKPGHINQDLTRYELHRVWEVEGTLRDGTRHVYAKRVFFIDEDSWIIAEADHYDGRGNLWRIAEAHQHFNYLGGIQAYSLETLYDISAGRYLAFGFENNENKGNDYDVTYSSVEFKPAALRRAGVR